MARFVVELPNFAHIYRIHILVRRVVFECRALRQMPKIPNFPATLVFVRERNYTWQNIIFQRQVEFSTF